MLVFDNSNIVGDVFIDTVDTVSVIWYLSKLFNIP